ncbi:PQQ-dependent sugar dehydrogenase [Chitinolyticbacter albus]|uniref:PQQ-dependent sugar dehydrogenase n=1 Tax=Chitinolyticbacter albus TaxID=2961951 RepID=UPI0021088DF1|nr:PQQ-dependent sugar dehydrogenase [Chitinolyticbacter albus]
MRYWLALASLGLNVVAQAGLPASTSNNYAAETIASGLEHPWSLAFLPDGRMLVTERAGRLRLVTIDGKLSAPIAGVPKVYASGQGGLLDVALDPAFAQNRLVYLSYAEPGNNDLAGTAVARARLIETASSARLEQLVVILRQQPKTVGGAHFGSRLAFARDGTLFVTMGERYQRDRAQELDVSFGKVLRIRPDGGIPPDNPYVGRKDVLPEIWSHGHRNPQSAAIHPATGALWTIEHGARGGDEINIPLAGRNYGWPVITYGHDYSGLPIGEGTAKAGMEQPVYYWDPSIAPSGMAFYTSNRYPGWNGTLLVGALKGQALVRLTLKGNQVVAEERLLGNAKQRIRDVRQGPDGWVYLLTDADDGAILRLKPR